ncbi:MAG: GMC family oxidoreductase N-terminal domain-containing protein [Nocardiopsaceae bacterium]|nr:GMC family oxidoreductase N-terminal domain-containing protein [Nocardiopsaceae bacterium]
MAGRGDGATEFDHVIVGAGSAGCVIARRLVDAGRRVALVEAGGIDDNPAIHDPGRAWELWDSPQDYAFITEPQEHSLKTSVSWPRGKVLGGSSALNGMIYVRGARADYDNWAYNGATGWSYADVLPYFLKSEDFEGRYGDEGRSGDEGRRGDSAGGQSEYHATGGPLPVTRNHDPNPVSLAFLDACAEYGIPLNDDCNGAEILGAGLCYLTIRNGRRASAWTSFVLPIADSPLLTVFTGAQVTGLAFDGDGDGDGGGSGRGASRAGGGGGGRVAGVRLADGRRLHSAGDVIVSAGAIGSPQLLLLSGIGPADDLRELDIDIRADLPGVGANLHDHMLATVLFESARSVPDGKANNLEAQFFATSEPGMPAPDLQPLMSHFPMPVPGYPQPDYGDGWAIVGGVIRPLSRGRLWLRSADPARHPALDPHYLEEPADRKALLAAMKLSREIGAGAALGEWRKREIAPGPDVTTDSELLEYSMANLITYHHQVGTCKMGIDRMAVTAPDLAVHGVEGLRVADASVMPAVTSGNTNAPTIMIAERCAALILGEHSLRED